MEGITKASEIAQPPTSAELELDGLKTKGGGNVTVLCKPVPPEIVLACWETIPVSVVNGGAPDAQEQRSQAIETAKMVTRSTPIIEAGAFVEGETGEVPLATVVKVQTLSIADRSALVATIAMVSGLTSQAPEWVRFRYDHGEGLGASNGAGRDGGEVRQDAEAVAPGGA